MVTVRLFIPEPFIPKKTYVHIVHFVHVLFNWLPPGERRVQNKNGLEYTTDFIECFIWILNLSIKCWDSYKESVHTWNNSYDSP